MKRSFMWYYSTILISVAVLGCLYDFLMGVDAEASFWGAAIFTPVAIWLFVTSRKGK